MHKKAATFKVRSYAWAFFCLFMLSFASSTKAEYKVVYRSPPAASEKAVKSTNPDGDIWRAFQSEFTLDHQADRPEVQEQIAWFMSHKKYLYAAARNARPYLYYINTQIRKHGLPAEFALLPIIESAYDPFAYSTAGAAGLWQMMPATATDFGLKQNWWYDGRRDIVASTNAALDYLVYLQNFFSGNWMFTVAAYHAGQGTVLNAVKKNAANGESTDFWSLPLGKQTQMYIPKLLALAEMIGHPEKYPLDMPAIPDKPYLSQVDVGSQIDLAKAAKLSGMSLSALMNLNPGFNRWATSPEGPFILLVPIQNEVQLREGLTLLPQGNRVTWERYDVQAGDTLSKIAAKYHTSMSLLQEVNKLENSVIIAGDVLFIPNATKRILPTSVSADSPIAAMKSATASVGAVRAVKESSSASPQKKRAQEVPVQMGSGATVYRVRQGDTLVSIARRLDVSWENIVTFNHLSTNSIKVGQILRIPPSAAPDKPLVVT